MPTALPPRRLVLGIVLLALAAMPALGQTRTVETTLGTFEVPENPTRIVTTHHANTQTLLDLGIVPVGRGAVAQGYTTPEQWAAIAEVPSIALEGGELNYELIASLDPDLILEVDLASSPERIERLRQIAPVVITPLRGEDFRFGKSPQIAEVVNAVDRWEALEAEYAARLAQIAEDYGEIAAAHPIAVLGVWASETPTVWTSDSGVGRIVAPAGAVFGAASEALPHEDGHEVIISQEDIPATLSDVDIIFYNSFADGSAVNGELDLVRELEVFQRLPAAQAGHVYPLGLLTVGSYAIAHNTLDHYIAALEAVAGE
jgi:ABC-type Fe3+-hydroxamate transport system, periplasmic component